MSRWNHNICEPCWIERTSAAGELGREPVRVRNAGVERCCFCGEANDGGIFVRGDPASPELKCGGTHGDEQ